MHVACVHACACAVSVSLVLPMAAHFSDVNLPAVGSLELDLGHLAARMHRCILRRLVRRVENDRVCVAVGERMSCRRQGHLGTCEDEHVVCGDVWPVELCNLLAQVETAAVGRVTQRVVVVQVEQRVVASSERVLDELGMREWLRK